VCGGKVKKVKNQWVVVLPQACMMKMLSKVTLPLTRYISPLPPTFPFFLYFFWK
jgi:hypothetical protein